jgi:hypothetical protein
LSGKTKWRLKTNGVVAKRIRGREYAHWMSGSQNYLKSAKRMNVVQNELNELCKMNWRGTHRLGATESYFALRKGNCRANGNEDWKRTRWSQNKLEGAKMEGRKIRRNAQKECAVRKMNLTSAKWICRVKWIRAGKGNYRGTMGVGGVQNYWKAQQEFAVRKMYGLDTKRIEGRIQILFGANKLIFFIRRRTITRRTYNNPDV